jgi:2-dehydro-3-deoxyphosphogluconate aldolase/(4S)-4-hydroxy-2-oxoglutarate aldolase
VTLLMNAQAQAQCQRLDDIVSLSPLLPVITINHPDTSVPLCEALMQGGLKVFEITLRTEYGPDAIRALRKALPDAFVGAGTVLTVEQYKQAEAAGAHFVVTPGITLPLLEYGLQAQVPLLPGIATASELMSGYQLGYRRFKFFPAEVAGGTAGLRALSGPFAGVRFCPTGGIRQNTAADYLALDNVMTVGGTWLAPEDAVATGDWARVRELARASLAELGVWSSVTET